MGNRLRCAECCFGDLSSWRMGRIARRKDRFGANAIGSPDNRAYIIQAADIVEDQNNREAVLGACCLGFRQSLDKQLVVGDLVHELQKYSGGSPGLPQSYKGILKIIDLPGDKGKV